MTQQRNPDSRLALGSFTEAVGRAADEERIAHRPRVVTDEERRLDAEKERHITIQLFATAISACVAELNRLEVKPEMHKVKLSHNDMLRTKLRGWLLPLLNSSDGSPQPIRLWVDRDASRWARIAPGDHEVWVVSPTSGASAWLPSWMLYSGEGKGSESAGGVRVVADTAVEGGLRFDRNIDGQASTQEPFRDALARGVARKAMSAGRLRATR